ncbi:MAG: sulfite exporter TauE/SafE family protein [Alphaproteobacteria bacterium]|nr:MAG: sulfite exporter TauE/SafE family protein [Alphaproteobacteria bacterium]
MNMTVTALIVVLGWGLVVGLVFSAIGAAGGILTSFGLITLFGMADPNAVKPMTQIVVLATALTFVPGYLRRGAVVPALGLLLGLGGMAGAWAGSTVSAHFLSDMATFRPLFGVLTLAIAAQIGWKVLRHLRARRAGSAEPMQAFSGAVTHKVLKLGCMCFDYGGTRYRVPILAPIAAGAAISFTAALFGVGGGFLLVPYMAAVLGMPMHIIPATSAIPIFLSLAVSVSNFLNLGARPDWGLLLPLVIGAVLGALIGPQLNRRLPNLWLQAGMAIVIGAIGFKYVLF